MLNCDVPVNRCAARANRIQFMSDGFYCKHCGSPNHLARDCNKPHLTYVPPPPPPGAPAPQPPEATAPTVAEPKLWPPRWPGGPPICSATNLPAFTDYAAAAKFRDANCPGAHFKRQWSCEDCGMVHYEATDRGSAGTTSGTERSKNPIPARPFVRAATRKLTAAIGAKAQDELPQNATASVVKPPDKPTPPRAKPATQSGLL